MRKKNKKYTFFRWYFWIMLFTGIYFLIEAIYNIDMRIVDSLLSLSILVLSIIAWRTFKKNSFPNVSKIVPITQIVYDIVLLILGFIIFYYAFRDISINNSLWTMIFTVMSVGCNLFKIIMSAYVLYIFKKS